MKNNEITDIFLFISGIAVLTLSGLSLFLGHQGFSLKLINLVYFLFTFAALIYIYHLAKERE